MRLRSGGEGEYRIPLYAEDKMGGGSFEHLYLKDVRELFAETEMLKQMESCLREHGSDIGANDTQAFVQELRRFERLMEYRIAALRNLWYTMEMRESGDFGDEQLAQAMQKYTTKRFA